MTNTVTDAPRRSTKRKASRHEPRRDRQRALGALVTTTAAVWTALIASHAGAAALTCRLA
jgi:hypothetical protein